MLKSFKIEMPQSGKSNSGACTNDVFEKEEVFLPPAVTNCSEREIEKYRRSTVKKSTSTNRYAMQSNENDLKSRNGHSSIMDKGKQSTKKKMSRKDKNYLEKKDQHRLQRTIRNSSESNTSIMEEVQRMYHHDYHRSPVNFSPMPWHSRCSIWLQPMLTAAIEELIDNKGKSIVRICESFLDDSEDEMVWKNMPTECHDIGVLIAALEGNITMLRCFLELGGDANATDLMGRTALHYAASSFRSDARHCIELLIKEDANIEVWDSTEIATPLICAAASGRLELVDVLINAGADVNAGQSDSTNPDCSSPLVWAVRSQSLVCARRLIRAGSSVNSLQVNSESPIHVAAIQGDPDCLKFLLNNKADTSLVFGEEKRNALHLASFEGHVECIRILLQHSKAQVNTKDSFGRTPLHLAALAQSVESVEELLKNGAEIENCDEMKMMPLHVAVYSCRSTEVVKLLISKGANVNAKDDYGQTPIHIAAYNENSKLVSLLIHLGADLSAKNVAKDSALASIVRRVPDALTAISSKLDSAIEIVDKKPTEPDCELRLDLKVLVPSGNQQTDGEMSFLASLVANEQRQILKHPLIAAFLHLKWIKIRTTFIISLIFQFLYVLSLTFSIYYAYVNVEENSNWMFTTAWWMAVYWGTAAGIKEMFQLYCNAYEYVRDMENYFEISSILAIVITHPSQPKDYIADDWRHHLAALLIIVAWFNLMLHVGRFPLFGIYVQMFTTVAWNICKLLVAYTSLLVGFSIGFAVLFPKSDHFSQMPGALLTTLVMMTGEMEYKNLFFGKNNVTSTSHVKYVGTSHFIFLFFVLFIVIVLMNLIVGLAVSDIQGLQKSADLNRLVRLTKQIVQMERIIFFPHGWLSMVPSLWLKWLNISSLLESIRENFLVLSPRARNKFWPNDPRDLFFPTKIKKSLLKIVVKRVANRKKESQKMTHLPAIRTVTGQTLLDSNNKELFTEVINRVGNLSQEIVSINTNIEQLKLAIYALRPQSV